MSSDFDWRTEDDGGWEETPEAGFVSPPADFLAWLRRWARFLLPAVFLLLVVGLAIVTLLNRRVEQAENNIAADVLAAHALVRQAVLNKDADLLDALLFGSNATWHELQLTLLNHNLFLNRRPLYLLARPEPAEPAGALAVSLSPDLQTAVLTDTITYEVTGGQQMSQTIHLERTFIYRRQENSWLLAPLPDDEDFWGKWRTVEEGDYFTLIYPLRDEAAAEYLAGPLGELVTRICEDSQIACPRGFTLELRLAREPGSLMQLNENFRNFFMAVNFGPQHLSLPAPSLVGRPLDEAGYQALYRGYANWIAGILVSRYAADLNQTIEQKLAGWGLEPPPRPVRALPLSYPLAQPPVPFPDQDILITCGFGDSFGLLRFNPRTNRWIDELAGSSADTLLAVGQFPFPQMISLPDDSGVVLSFYQIQEGTLAHHLVAWQNGREQVLLQGEFGLDFAPEPFQQQFDPTRQRLVFFTNFGNPASGDSQTQVHWLDLPACLEGDCQLQTVGGLITWSPSGEHWLVTEINGPASLALQEEQSEDEVILENGYAPIWLDNESFVYIRAGEGPAGSGLGFGATADLVLTTIDDPTNGTVLLNTSEMAAVLPARYQSSLVSVQSVIPHPHHPGRLLVAILAFLEDGPQTSFILSYDLDSGEVAYLEALGDQSLLYAPQLSPDREFLVVRTYGPGEGGFAADGQLTFIALGDSDLPSAQRFRVGYQGQDWSQDGRWLLIAQERSLRLFAPHAQYETVIRHNLESCSHALWVNVEVDEQAGSAPR